MTFLLKAIINYWTFSLLTRGLFGYILDSISAFFYWILLLDSYTGFYYLIFFMLIPTPHSRDRVTIKVQLGTSSLIVEDLSTKFIIDLHTLVYLFVRGFNKWQSVTSFQILQMERLFQSLITTKCSWG